MDNKEELKEIEEQEKVRESEQIDKYGTDIKKLGKQYSIEEAKKIREKREKRDDMWFKFFIIMQIVFIIVLLIAMVLIYKYIGDNVRIRL